MISIQLLNGKRTGAKVEARSFPFFIGRGSASDWVVEEPGVWERHVGIELDASKRFQLKVHPEALARLNGASVMEAPISNGDIIDLGSLRLQIWLSKADQKDLRLRETASWLAVACLFTSQIALIYFALP